MPLLFSYGGGGMATSVSTILTNVRYKIVDPDSVNFTDAELLVYLNEADRTIRNLIAFHAPQFLETTETGTADSDNYIITLSSYATKMTDVKIDGKSIPMISKADISDIDDEGKPRGYFMQDFNTLRLYPIPSDTYSYTVMYVPNYESLDSTDDLRYPEMLDDLLGEFIVLRCIARDEGSPTIEAEMFKNWRGQIAQLLSSFGYNEGTVRRYYHSSPVTDDYGVV